MEKPIDGLNVNKHFYYSPEMLFEDVKVLSMDLKKFSFNVILGIAKGGLIPTTLLAYQLKIKDLRTVQIFSYCDETNRQGCITEINSCAPFKDTDHVLIVDDIADSGKTIQFILDRYKIKNYKIVTLILKEHSKIIPDFYARKTNLWVDFFWELPQNPKE
jgi:hypoxanthine phosphoribosyltransferase